MALVTLSTGKTIDVDIIWFLTLSDEEYQDLVAMNTGFEVDNPFHGSALSKKGSVPEEVIEEEDEPKPVDSIEEVEIHERDDI